MIKKTQDGFVRDPNNDGAIINTDREALLAYKRQKNKFRELDEMKAEIKDIKKMLNAILSKL